MRIRKTKLLESSYLDPEEKFYDYRTKNVEGEDIFDTSKSELSYYTDILTNPDYIKNKKNLVGKIEYLSPKEYFEGCAKIFGTPAQKQIDYTKIDRDTFNHLKDVIFKYKRTFPITVLNYAEKQQEGRHRMYFAGETFGWDKKFPVLVVNWADEEKHQRDEYQKEIDKRQQKLDKAVQDALQYSYFYSDDIKEQIENNIENEFQYENIKPKVKFTDIGNTTIVSLGRDVETSFERDEIKLKDEDEIDDEFIDDIDLDDEETKKMLDRYGLKL